MKSRIKVWLICIGLTIVDITAFVVCGQTKPPWSSALLAVGIFLTEMLIVLVGTIILVKKEFNMVKKKNWAVDLAERSGKSRAAIYKLAERLGRRPTLREVKNQRNGRPPKF